MANDLSRDDTDSRIAQARRVLLAHYGHWLETERAKDELEQIVSSVTRHLSEEDRRSVVGFAERLIGAVWSETLSINEACLKIEEIVNAAAVSSDEFRALVTR